MICANPKCGKEFIPLRKDKVCCSKECGTVVWKLANPGKVKAISVMANRRYRIKKGLKGVSTKLFQWCNFCQCEHQRNENNFYLYQHPQKNTPQFLCKKEVLHRSFEWAQLNPKKRKEIALRYDRIAIELIYPSYAMEKLYQQGITSPKPETVEQKRLILKLKRTIYEKQRLLNTH